VSTIGYQVQSRVRGTLSVKLDAPEGTEIGRLTIEKQDEDWVTVNCPIQSATGVHDLYFVFTSTDDFDIQDIRYLLMINKLFFQKDQPINP
jgi:hypothetical protein